MPDECGNGIENFRNVALAGLRLGRTNGKILRSLSAVGLTARGFRGEDTEMTGCVFQVSNEHTLGVSETETLETMRRWTQDIAEQEIRARRRVIRRENERFADRIARAYGTLRFAISLSEAESLELISLLRWACDEEIFPRGTRNGSTNFQSKPALHTFRVAPLFAGTQSPKFTKISCGHVCFVRRFPPSDRRTFRIFFNRKTLRFFCIE